MKKAIIFLFCLMLLPTQAMAIDWTGVYIAPRFNIAYTDMDTIKGGGKKSNGDDTVLGGSLALGYTFRTLFNIPLRTEVEYSMYGRADDNFKKGGDKVASKLDAETLFLNVYYDFAVTWPVKPYIGAGVGMAFLHNKGSVDGISLGTKHTYNFAANGQAGVSFVVNPNLAVDLGYRFAYLGDAKTGSSSLGRVKTEDVMHHQGNIGFRWTF